MQTEFDHKAYKLFYLIFSALVYSPYDKVSLQKTISSVSFFIFLFFQTRSNGFYFHDNNRAFTLSNRRLRLLGLVNKKYCHFEAKSIID